MATHSPTNPHTVIPMTVSVVSVLGRCWGPHRDHDTAAPNLLQHTLFIMDAAETMTEPEDDGVRFEDLTVDDDLPIIDRMVRYIHSAVALQRLVHVKMLAEAAALSGMVTTRDVLVPALEPLVIDPESVIRQHLAAQLVPIAIVTMMSSLQGRTVAQWMDAPSEWERKYDTKGYRVVTETILEHLNTLIADTDLDVRRAAAGAMAGLALQLEPEDVPALCLPVPLRLVYQKPQNPTASKSKKSEADQRLEELRITAANLLAELAGAASEHERLHSEAHWVGAQLLPAILELCEDPSFRVRRAGIQALPRLLGACTLDEVQNKIVPVFERLSQDPVHRIRKSSGECLVDMSRSLMILAGKQEHPERRKALYDLRRERLIPVADRLIQDSHKMVRQGMMQFLGPFIASFYPYQFSPLHTLLPSSTESDGSNHTGIAAQFFPHATSMVARLNSSQNSITTAPTPVHSSLEQLSPKELSSVAKLKRALPVFIQASRMSSMSLTAVLEHRRAHPPDPDDIAAISDRLLDYFAALAIVTTGDENTDAEMRVYCAYSLPAIVLLLGEDNWEGPMKTCFFSLLNSNYAEDPEGEESAVEPPLPVKRCIASSLHTVAHVLSPETAVAEIFPVYQNVFLKDSDESVRLNVIRNFPSLLQILPPTKRKKPFLLWSEVVRGEEFLGAKKRSATNPLVLNWRQRDYLARSLPDLLMLLDPTLVHEHVWPILQELLTDGVSTVREDAIWAIPMLLKAYCPDNLRRWEISFSKNWSDESCSVIVAWLKEKILRLGTTEPNARQNKPANFSDRQLYCRVCATVGLALRFAEDLQEKPEDKKDPVSVLSDKFRMLFSSPKDESMQGPYQKLTAPEQKHLKRLLMEELLDSALAMNEDRISNVRVTLMKVLQLMPEDIRTSPKCKPVLKNLVEEVETWESFGPEPIFFEEESQAPASPKEKKSRGGGPVDVDEVGITPSNSRDEDDGSDERARSRSIDPSQTGDEEGTTKTVVFEDGPIGMQLEPTVEERACRVFSFLDGEKPSPARLSGMIGIGDVILSVNGARAKSYEQTITMLKAGGRREIVFRPGREEDTYDDNMSGEEGIGSTDEEGEEGDERERKKREKKAKKEAKRKKDSKKDKKKKKESKKKKKPGSDNESD